MTIPPIDLSIYADEEALLQGLRRGERHACACMLKHFASRVYAVALRMMGDPQEAEEVLQDTFISACKNIAHFESRSSLATWLHRIAVNAALMRLRKRKRYEVSIDAPIETLEGEDIPRQIEDWRHYPADRLLDAETRQVLQEAIAALPETLRTVYVLRELEGYSTQEAAEMLHISENAAKVRLHRARLALREQLTPYFAGHVAPEAAV
ncbi:MAG: sigma-70 family RNA polymerase sigma factor [Caldilineales bacterium]|nr:sigma-70 family RNA polymerase sigma factor [Caldilineales bacterium]